MAGPLTELVEAVCVSWLKRSGYVIIRTIAMWLWYNGPWLWDYVALVQWLCGFGTMAMALVQWLCGFGTMAMWLWDNGYGFGIRLGR